MMRYALISLITCLLITTGATAGLVGHVYQVTHTQFTSDRDYADPFNDVELDMIVTTPSGREMRVPGFWAGGRSWMVRRTSREVGTHRYRTVCSDASNRGLHGKEATYTVAAPLAHGGALGRHGPIRVSGNKRHFEHADGTPFFWLADTQWMGLTKRLVYPYEFEPLANDRAAKGFTVVQIVAGLYPDMPAFDPRGANEAGFPWEKDYARINPAYFDHADKRVDHLVSRGLVPCIVGAWGYHLPWLGEEKMKKHWRYLIARWGAYPVVWCVAGEGAMPYYLSNEKEKEREFQRRGWTEIARYVRETDPFDRPITIHPTDMSRNQVTDASVLDFEMLQTGHGDRASIAPTIALLRASRAAEPTMPTINSEVCYEGILGTCDAKIQRIMAWTSLLAGTAGHTYGANGIWQVNRKGEPYGKSPHGGNWGETPWNEAMNLPGSAQVGLAKRLLEQFEWWRFEPHEDWAAWAAQRDQSAIEWGAWMWHAADGDAAHDAPVAKPRRFRKRFNLTGAVKSAVIHVSADDRFSLVVNGQGVGGSDNSNESWRRPRRFDIAALLTPGENIVQVDAENVASNVANNPAGVISAGEVLVTDGKAISLASDATWESAAGDDQVVAAVKLIGQYGVAPWGEFAAAGPLMPPQAAGVPDVVRVIYLAEPTPVRVMNLEQTVEWTAEHFNPVTGERTQLAMPEIDGAGTARFDAPTGADDWVLVLRRR